MFKIIASVFLIIILSGSCATTYKRAGKSTENINQPAIEILNSVFNKNLTGTGFFVEKGKILTSGENGRISLYFTMKYLKGSKYLISIRSKTGMEAFRVYISNDSVLVNDRLNKNVLYGNTNDFQKITGIPADLLKVSVGDIFMNRPMTENSNQCVNNEIKIHDYYQGLIINSTVDCLIKKTKSAIISTGGVNEFIVIKYSRFRDDAFSVPKKIEVNDPGRKIRIIISIDKYSAPWVGEIQFKPGEGYSTRPLI